MKKWITKDRFRRIEVLTFLVLLAHVALLASRSKLPRVPLAWQYVVDSPLQQKLAFAYQPYANIPIVYETAAVVGLIACMILLKIRTFRAAAKSDDKAGISRYRWYELGVGGALLVAYVSHLAGAYNPAIIVSIIAAGVIFGMAGSRIEVERAAKTPVPKQTTWTLILSTVVIWSFFAQHIGACIMNSPSTPIWLYGIAGAVAAYWILHGLLIRLSYAKKSKASITSTLFKHRIITILVLATISWLVVYYLG